MMETTQCARGGNTGFFPNKRLCEIHLDNSAFKREALVKIA